MGFRYYMRDKTGQQQAIVRARDEEEKLREQARIWGQSTISRSWSRFNPDI